MSLVLPTFIYPFTHRKLTIHITNMSTDRGTCWSITINNPLPADDDNIALARQKSGWSVIGQIEKGTEGTPHYQIMLKTPQVRFSAVKKAFPRAHIELARNHKALEEYVQKEDTREGDLPTSDRYPSMAKLWELFNTWCSDKDYHKKYQLWNSDTWLEKFDFFINETIMQGYVVETMAVNPQVRSIVKNYGYAIMTRQDQLNHESTQEITLPEYIQDANESAPPQTDNCSETSSCGGSTEASDDF